MIFKFELGEIVFIKMESEQKEKMILSREEMIGGSIRYVITDGMHESICYEQELTTEKDVVKYLNSSTC